MMVRLMPDWKGLGRPLAYRPLGGRMTVLREEYADVPDAAHLVRRAGQGGRRAGNARPGADPVTTAAAAPERAISG
jgi:hypothetical protein